MDKLEGIIGLVALAYISYLEIRLRAMGANVREAKIEAFKAQAINRIKSLSDDALKQSLDKRLRDS